MWEKERDECINRFVNSHISINYDLQKINSNFVSKPRVELSELKHPHPHT